MEFDATTYGHFIADDYDSLFTLSDTGDTVEFLVEELAARGPDSRFLELGVGTARIAGPLADRGYTGVGVDSSQAMLDKAVGKLANRDAVSLLNADMTQLHLGEKFELVFAAFNTVFCLLSQDDQVATFGRAAEHLAAGGTFVMDGFVPDLRWLCEADLLRAGRIEVNGVTFHVTEHDVDEQTMTSQLLALRDGQLPKLYPIRMRYAWFSELTLMAQIAGLRLTNRYGAWDRQIWQPEDGRHVLQFELA